MSSAANWVRTRGEIKLETSFTLTDDEEAVRQRAQAYLASIGYRQVRSEPYLEWRRSSWLRTLVTFSPKKVARKMTLHTRFQEQARIVEVVLHVLTLGGVVGQSDLDFWSAEVDGLEHALRSSDSLTASGLSDLEQAAVAESHRMLAWYSKKGLIPLVVGVGAILFIGVVGVPFLPPRVFGLETRLAALALIVLVFWVRAALAARRPPKRYPGQPRL